MRIITLNVNGIRSAERRGLLRWMAEQDADVVCLQETRAQRDDLGPSVVALHGYHSFFHHSDKKGYSGVALYTRKAPRRVVYGLDWNDVDREGRYLQADFADYSVVSLYIPSGSSSEARQQAKFAFLDRFLPVLAGLRQDGREYLLCGDWNIAHKPIDLKNWRANQKNSGFLPEERAWLDRVFGEIGCVDAFRSSTRSRSSTPGGPIAARPGPRTSDGASTTRSSRRRWRRTIRSAGSTRIGAFPTMPRSPWITICDRCRCLRQGRRFFRCGFPRKRRPISPQSLSKRPVGRGMRRSMSSASAPNARHGPLARLYQAKQLGRNRIVASARKSRVTRKDAYR